MDKKPDFIPNDKDDSIAIDHLNKADWDAVVPHVDSLLEWIKDMNWPVSGAIAKMLALHTNSIKENIIKVLKGDDGLWKYWCIQQLVYYSQESSIDIDILKELKKIVQSPSEEEQLEEVDEIAKETLDRWGADNS